MRQLSFAEDAAARASRYCHSAINAATSASGAAESLELAARDARLTADGAAKNAKQCLEAESGSFSFVGNFHFRFFRMGCQGELQNGS